MAAERRQMERGLTASPTPLRGDPDSPLKRAAMLTLPESIQRLTGTSASPKARTGTPRRESSPGGPDYLDPTAGPPPPKPTRRDSRERRSAVIHRPKMLSELSPRARKKSASTTALARPVAPPRRAAAEAEGGANEETTGAANGHVGASLGATYT